MPVSLDTSFVLRPDAAARAHEARLREASAEDCQRFASELARAQSATAAERTDATETSSGAPTLVPAARTRLSGDEAASALRAAWTAVRGEPPSSETLSILVGQWAHETGRGASMLNYNFGGLKGTGPTGLSAACSTREGWGDDAVRVVDRFRAYGSAEEGARDYVSLLARRYPDAVDAAQKGDARGFVQGLKARGYFTDNEAAYSKSVQSLASLALRAGFGAVSGGAANSGTQSAGTPIAGTPGAATPGAGRLRVGTLRGDLPSTPAVPPGLSARGALARAELPGATPTPLSPASLLDGGALLERTTEFGDRPLAGLPVAPGAFADEVNRAALLMSALRIAEPRSRGG